MIKRILNFIDQDKKLKDINNKINDINSKIYSLKKEKNGSSSLTRLPMYIDAEISNLEEELRMKKECQNQLIDERNYFIFKLFWNIIVPIFVSVVVTFLINIYLK